ncbi:site-specific integrase [Neiella sp. HB171785]|uniref:Site-specific integrase n=1 Tax=Neiella litorisoli TaxID=2771431 RepID=A0A8J6UFK1_9GAMM|nr:site-specific integrase [Neiella litorisoli]MBD1388861.1 site-specific integrase [Neiella litorisoli]
MTSPTLLVPKPTTREPHKQLQWLFLLLKREKPTANVDQALNWYLEYLSKTNGGYGRLKQDQRFFIQEYWEADALLRFTKWLVLQKRIKSLTRYSIYKLVRQAMDWAYELGLINAVVYHAPIFKGVPETNERAPYSEAEQEIIDVALSRALVHAKRVSEPYEKTNLGIPYCRPNKDPLVVQGKELSVIDASGKYGIPQNTITERRRKGWSDEQCLGLAPPPERNIENGKPVKVTVEGVEWPSITSAARNYKVCASLANSRLATGYRPEQAFGLEPLVSKRGSFESTLFEFEERYSCDPLRMLLAVKKDRSITIKSLMNFYIRIGVWPFVDRRLILPLAAELSRLTGLNAESVASLTLDSYQPHHPLTGQPFIAYTKVRAGNENQSEDKELHLTLLEQGEHFIKDELQRRVSDLIALTQTLTAPLRSHAKGDATNKLFIYEHDCWNQNPSNALIHRVTHIIWRGPTKQHKANNSDALTATPWAKQFCKENNLYALLGEDFMFNFSRFRSTSINNMVKAGADIFEIQATAGHNSLVTTSTYLDDNFLENEFHTTIGTALVEISHSKPSKDSARHSDAKASDKNPTGVTETLSGLRCKDAFNPSAKVRQLTKHIDGSPCKFWNMCLLCEQSSVHEGGLPKLIAYKWKLELSLEENRANMKKRNELYRAVLLVINDLLTPDHHFPEDVLKQSKSLAIELDDEEIDQLVYMGL